MIGLTFLTNSVNSKVSIATPIRNYILDYYRCVQNITESDKSHTMILDNASEIIIDQAICFLLVFNISTQTQLRVCSNFISWDPGMGGAC